VSRSKSPSSKTRTKPEKTSSGSGSAKKKTSTRKAVIHPNKFVAYTRTKQGIVTVLMSLVIVCLAAALAVVSISKNESGGSGSDQQVQKVSRSVSGASSDKDKASAMAAAATLLTAANKHSANLSADDRVKAFEDSSADRSTLADMSTIDSLTRFTNDFDNDLRKTTYQSLVKVSSLLDGNNDGKIEARSSDLYKYVYLDSETGTAYVPLQVFFNNAPAFSLEMVYVDGQWKFAPYTLLDAIRLSSSMSGVHPQQTGSDASQK
jgi:hypothetical protein